MEWLWPSVPQPLRDWLEAGITFGLSAASGVVLRTLTVVALARPAAAGVPFAVAAKKPLSALAFWGALIAGADMAVRQFDRVHPDIVKAVDRGLAVAWIALIVFAVIRYATVRLKAAQLAAADPAHVDRLAVAQKLVSGLALGIGGLLAMRTAGLDITPLLAGGAIGGVIIGLALQESLANVFSGLMINLDSSVALGDTVRLPTGEEGVIENVGWRTTCIRQWDESLLVVPNSLLSKQSLINLSRDGRLYVLDVQGRVPFGADLETAERLLVGAAVAIQREFGGTETARPPVLRWRELVDGHIVFKVYVEIGDAYDQYRARSALMKGIYEALAQGGILIAADPPAAPAPAPTE